ncbi:hypothetical protein M2451_000332 [Dysgonomonas sp. PFB1-18]|uniref:GIN domain-containing protein n=1 Tax=unclassified Dysgonomonas TaxID=2630389 RepID=UPI002473082C|nr:MULTISPECIES: DUF2807 domain-containing protein [unclassified Dysgonomonas]MDH6307883.1 hypothetical protein [Dysgonomonas sp. PF1-14]MDH6337801.1 hypothetical protein [Dysgonomonas sp. PF1-16]MDH6379025.1 hypothetical protein [Dysgonomonas sp. PFB1-18]MDH6396660.1 hypothetical protein [Dysgonomonas sp. PF1-23]
MKTILYILGVIALTAMLYSCDPEAVRGNKKVKEYEVDIKDYNSFAFQMRGSKMAKIIYQQRPDATPYLRIVTDENIYDLLDIVSDSSGLSIKDNVKITPSRMEIYTNSSDLRKMVIVSYAKVLLKGKLETPELLLESYGMGDITNDSIICDRLEAKIFGMADVILTGKVNKFDAYIAGKSKIDAFALHADSVSCTGEGMGNFRVYADKYLKANISGMGKVNYKGNAKVEQEVSGLGGVEKID